MERLFQAAQRLREAVQAMAQQPAGDRRKHAMDAANQALLETQQAMAQVSAIGQSSSNSQGSRSGSSSSNSSGNSQGTNSGSSGSSK